MAGWQLVKCTSTYHIAFLEGGWEIMHVAFFFAIVCEVVEFREVF